MASSRVASPGHENPLVRKLQGLFRLTAEEEQVLVDACSRTVRLNADEDIVVEGDRPSDCNLLLEGMAFRYKLLPDGKRQIMSFHRAGDIFDAQSFILELMDHSIATLTPCKVATIPHRIMLEITETYPRIARAIWKDTLVDAAVFREWMASIGRRSAYSRIAHLLCEEYVRSKVVGLAKEHSFVWPVTQVQVGDALGLSFVHVNRSLKELRENGLVTVKRGKVMIHDWPGLKHAGQFDPLYLHMRPADEPARAAGESGNGARHTEA